ncbi:hypothetical protein K439DRAFT_1622132 [Ramaria rubella]|nr:hypothetical protein K439DRAFT_1622132 [Ramaria rubella]
MSPLLVCPLCRPWQRAVQAWMALFGCAPPPGCADVAVRNGAAYAQSKKIWGPLEGPLGWMWAVWVDVARPGGCGWAGRTASLWWQRERIGMTWNVMHSDIIVSNSGKHVLGSQLSAHVTDADYARVYALA